MEVEQVVPTPPTQGTLIEAMYEAPDYVDAYVVDCGERSVEDFAVHFFLCQPRWLARVSMNLGGGESRTQALAGREFGEGSSVGSWKVHGRGENEIVFGEHMGFMEYRFSFLKREDGRIEAATAVKYLKRFGSVYFGTVKPFHKRFVQIALRNAASSNREEVAA